jgi:hypothetical protein
MLTPNLITNALVPLVRDQQEEQNEEDQTNHRDTRILTWKTLQSEGKNHGHQSVTTFTIFIEYLQERRDLFWRLTRGLYSKTLICSPTWLALKNLDYNSTDIAVCNRKSMEQTRPVPLAGWHYK